MRTVSPGRAPARASALSTPRRSRRPWAYVERLGVGEVGQGDGPLGLPADDRPRTRRRRARPGTPSAAGRCTTKASGLRELGPGSLDRLGHPPDQLAHAVAGDGGDAGGRRTPRPARPGRRGSRRPAGGARAGRAGSGRSSSRRIRSCSAGGCGASGREVEQEHEHPGPLHVAEEPVPEPSPVAGPLDETGDVGDDELGVVAQPHHAQVGLEGGEGVVGDLRLGRRDGGDERGLAGRWGTRPGPRRRAASARAAASAPRPPRPARRRRGPAAGSTGTGRCRARRDRPRRRATAPRRRRGRRARRRRWSRTVVPSGTGTSRSLPRRPCLRLPCPCAPLPPRRCGWSLKAISDAMLRSTTSHTSPPSPPSPPSGPPLGTCASRRKLTAPAPPSPPLAWRPHSSTNCDTKRGYGSGGVKPRSRCRGWDQFRPAAAAGSTVVVVLPLKLILSPTIRPSMCRTTLPWRLMTARLGIDAARDRCRSCRRRSWPSSWCAPGRSTRRHRWRRRSDPPGTGAARRCRCRCG